MRTSKRNAISPILATIILIAITIAGGLLVYNVFFSSSGTASKAAQVQITSVSLVKSSSGSEVFTMQLKNSGNQPLQEASLALLLDGSAPSGFSTPSSAQLQPGDSMVVTVSSGLTYNIGDSVSVSISMSGTSSAATAQVSVTVSG